MLNGIEKAIACVDANHEDKPLKNSSWSIHQHLEHLCLTGRSTPLLIQSALDTLEGPSSQAISAELFRRGEIPRGETQAPEFGLPRGMKIKKLRNGLCRLHDTLSEICRENVSILSHQGRSLHPALGGLTPREWITFIGLHFNHHLSIIDDES